MVAVGVVLTLAIVAERKFFGTSHLSKAFGKESQQNLGAKSKMQPFVIILLIILVAIPIIYSIFFNTK